MVFGIAALCCLCPRNARVWGILAAIHILFLAEMFLDVRFTVHNRFDRMLQLVGLYEHRAFLQVPLLALLLLCIIMMLRFAMRGENAKTVKLAQGASLFTMLIFVFEIISLHRIDTLLYFQLAGIMVIAWLWSLSATIVAVSALLSVRTSRTEKSAR